MLFIVLFSFSCSNKEDDSITETVEPEVVTEEVVSTPEPQPEPEPVKKEKPKFSVEVKDISAKSEVISNIDLDEEVIFTPLEDITLDSNSFAVVASHQAKLFPLVELKGDEDLVNLNEGTPIEIGTIIPLEETIEKDTTDWNNFFKYEKNYNYFYKTTINGTTGLVWGADLNLKMKNLEDAKKLSYYYTKETKSESFVPFNGKRDLSLHMQEKLIEDRIAFEEVSPREYRLSIDNPDDMIALYKLESKSRENTIFISTDLIVHSVHLIFNNFLQSIEEHDMLPKLDILVDKFLNSIISHKESDTKEYERYTELLKQVENYFMVAKVLINYTEDEVKIQELLNSYPEEIRKEYELIKNHGGFMMSPTLNYREDYSQYLARGHYTKNDQLRAYFMTMMWFGRIHMHMTSSDSPIIFSENDSNDTSYQGTTMALFINKIAQENSELYKLWSSLFDPITYLIGESDDLSFYDILPVMEFVDVDNFPEWMSDADNINNFIIQAEEKLRAPQIAGNSVFLAPSVDNKLPPMGYRLFGQRFTYDSSIHHKLSPPRLEGRVWVNGLDIMTAFGSKSAAHLLNSSEGDTPYAEAYKKTMADFMTFFKNSDDDFWGKTFYNRYLDLIRQIAQFEQGAGYYYTHKGKWNQKTLTTAHAAWAELRHDTILYVKQSYAERAGGGDMEATFRTIPYERPIHYVEPNMDFYIALNKLLKDTVENVDFNSMGKEYKDKFQKLAEMSNKLIEIVELEMTDRPISEQQNKYLTTVPSLLARIVLSAEAGMAGYIEDTDSIKLPIIADVFTQSEAGAVLEIGTGIPYRMYVTLNDNHGGKRVATGYTFSYYEFHHPMSDRLTNEKWRKEVYNTNADLSERLPFWSKDILD